MYISPLQLLVVSSAAATHRPQDSESAPTHKKLLCSLVCTHSSSFIQLKGYIHQGDHTPTCLKAETLRLYFIICGKQQFGTNDQNLTQTFIEIVIFLVCSRLARTLLMTIWSSLAQICMSWWTEE